MFKISCSCRLSRKPSENKSSKSPSRTWTANCTQSLAVSKMIWFVTLDMIASGKRVNWYGQFQLCCCSSERATTVMPLCALRSNKKPESPKLATPMVSPSSAKTMIVEAPYASALSSAATSEAAARCSTVLPSSLASAEATPPGANARLACSMSPVAYAAALTPYLANCTMQPTPSATPSADSLMKKASSHAPNFFFKMWAPDHNFKFCASCGAFPGVSGST
mmetsp:Transcript_25598/g.73080  ORF Transcript_25598/g.73080 Transcript_25598/m.73080 type:complete len:222 (-) Transcript_25598:1238-1903(-)